MTITTTNSPLCCSQWRRVGSHPSSLPDLIPTEKRLFRKTNTDNYENIFNAINHIARKFIWEANNTFNDQDHRWRKDAFYLINHPIGDINIKIDLCNSAGINFEV